MNSQSHKFSQKNFSAVSRQDGLVLDVLALVPESPKAIVQLAHGMCEHKERYLPFMEYLAGLGFLCVINDHRGHGKKRERYGRPGLFLCQRRAVPGKGSPSDYLYDPETVP